MAQQSAGEVRGYKFFVDDQAFESPQPIITGAQIREIAHVDASSNVFLNIARRRNHNPDLLIHNSTTVNLAEPGMEKFYTLHRPTLDIY